MELNLKRRLIARMYSTKVYGNKRLYQIENLYQYEDEGDHAFLGRANRYAEVHGYVHTVELKK